MSHPIRLKILDTFIIISSTKRPVIIYTDALYINVNSGLFLKVT